MTLKNENLLSVQMNLTGLDPLVENFPSVIHEILKLVAVALQSMIQEEAPIDTGKLRGSVAFPYSLSPLQFIIPINARYWTNVQFGTGKFGPGKKPFDIEPKSPGGTLHFVKEGKHIFVKRVKNHPGQKPNPFVDRAIDKTMERIPDLLKGYLEGVLS